MKASYTPGPWAVVDTGDPADMLDIIGRPSAPASEWQMLAMVMDDADNGVLWDETRANAVLIAAAPTMYAALALADRALHVPPYAYNIDRLATVQLRQQARDAVRRALDLVEGVEA